MKESFTKQALNAIETARILAFRWGHKHTGSEHLLMGLLSVEESTAAMVLKKSGITYEKASELIDRLVAGRSREKTGRVKMSDTPGFSPAALKILETAKEEAVNMTDEKCGTEHILMALLQTHDCLAMRLLTTLGIEVRLVYSEIWEAVGLDPAHCERYYERRSMQGSGQENIPTLERFSKDLTFMAQSGGLDPVIGRNTEINRLIRILNRRTKNNPCLTGEPGVGKTAIIEGLALRIADGNVPENMKSKRILVLDMSAMVAGTKYRGEFEERIKNVLDEVMNSSDIILFIDELHTIIGAGGAEGAMDAANILKPALSRGEIQIIGATTLDEYRKYIEKDMALERRFQPIQVSEPTRAETYEILKGLKTYYEDHHKVEIEDAALKAAVELSSRYISDRFLPDKAIDLMDEAASKVRMEQYEGPNISIPAQDDLKALEVQRDELLKEGDFEGVSELNRQIAEKRDLLAAEKKAVQKKKKRKGLKVTPEDMAIAVSGWTGIPVSRLTETESRRLSRLEKILEKRVIGQDEALNAVARAVRRGRAGIKDPKRPTGVFLFLGPTGVGKTELSKAVAEAVYGSENSLIRFDMSEYMEKVNVSRLIGSPPGYVGYEEGGQLSDKVRNNPYSVVLFDEIEKAHPDIFNILLQIMDEGRITDSHGKIIDFKNTCVIMTSNAGASAIASARSLGFAAFENEKQDYDTMKERAMESVKKIFKPEFLNRIDETIVFRSLNKADIKKILALQVKILAKRCSEQMDITLSLTAPAAELIVEEHYDRKYGARPIKRAVQSLIEDPLSEMILKKEVVSGDKIRIVSRNKKAVLEKVSDELPL